MTRKSYLLLVGITVLGLLLRLNGVDDEGLWLDESICWRDVHASWPDFVDTLLIGECMPPLFFALLKLWTGLVGESVLALRLPSVVFGTLTIPLLGRFVGRLAGPGTGCLAALFLAVSPFHVFYSQEARPYAFYPFIVLAATAALAWALEDRGRGLKHQPEAQARSFRKKSGSFAQSPFVLFAFYGFLALLAFSSDYPYAISVFSTLAATAVLFWALEKWKGQRPGQLEIYAFVAVLAFFLRFCFNAFPVLVLAGTSATLWGLEYALEKRQGANCPWRSGIYAFLAVITFLSHFLYIVLPFLVLAATAAAFWALEMRLGPKHAGREQIYAFPVFFAFCILFHDDGLSFGILAASVTLCWALEKWKRGNRRSEMDSASKAETRIATDPVPPAPSDSRPVSPSPLVRFAVYAFLALLACYTHYFSAFFMAAHGVLVALVCWIERSLQPARAWILCMVAVGICFLAWLPIMLQFDLAGTDWVAYYLRVWSPLMQLWLTIKWLAFGLTYPLWLGNAFPDAVLVLMPLAVWLGYRRSLEPGGGSQAAGVWTDARNQESGVRNQESAAGNPGFEDSQQHPGANPSLTSAAPSCIGPDSRPLASDGFAFALLSVMTVVPLLIAWAFSQFRPSLVPRYIIPVVPALMALIALATWRARWLVLRVLLAGALAVYFFGSLQWQQGSHAHPELTSPSRAELNLAAAYIAAHLQPGDALIVDPAQHYLVLRYYLRERMPTVVNESDAFVAPDKLTVPENLAASLAPFKRVWYVRQETYLSSPIESYLDAHYSQAAAARHFHKVPVVKLYLVK